MELIPPRIVKPALDHSCMGEFGVCLTLDEPDSGRIDAARGAAGTR
jgi:hypothetical protein